MAQTVSNHKALTSILKGNTANKTYSSQLTCWVDRLLLYQYIVTHAPDRTLGMANYLSRHPSPSNNNVQVKAEEFRNNWFTVNKIKSERIVSDEQITQESENPPITAVLIEKSNRTDRNGMASETTLSKQATNN